MREATSIDGSTALPTHAPAAGTALVAGLLAAGLLVGACIAGLAGAADAATRFVALRVEHEALRASAEATVIALRVQVAPEDRGRIGSSAWVELELRDGETVIEHLARAVEVDATGTAHLELTWPPGSWLLEVRIEGGRGHEEGVWKGPIRVPQLATGEPTPVPPAASPRPAEPPPPRPEPAEAPAPPATPAPRPQQISTPVAQDAEPATTDLGTWGHAAPDQVELTVVVTARNQPVRGLTAHDLRLELDGDDVPVTALGDGSAAPARVALAVDLSASMSEHLPTLRAQLSRLAVSITSSGGELTLLTVPPGPEAPTAPEDAGDAGPEVRLDWDATAEDVAGALDAANAPGPVDLAGLIASASGRLDRGGRSFLVVVTDGGEQGSREGWEQAVAAVETSGAQVLLIGFRSDDLGRRTRRRLDDLVASSGGRSYMLRDTQTLSLVCDYFAELIDASYALRAPSPGGTASTASIRVDLEARGPGLETHHPEQVRRRVPPS